jgi:hypothetical protein
MSRLATGDQSVSGLVNAPQKGLLSYPFYLEVASVVVLLVDELQHSMLRRYAQEVNLSTGIAARPVGYM